MITIFNEDFSDFPLEEFPYDKEHTALGEYHHLMPKGYMGNFYDPINNHQWRSMGGSWLVCNYDGQNYMEQNRGYHVKGHFSEVTSLLVLQKCFVHDFMISTRLMMYSTLHQTGISFCYIHSRKYYAFVFENEKAVLYYKNQSEKTIINEVDFDYQDNIDYSIIIEKKDETIKVYINDILILKGKCDFLNAGSCALLSQNACRYAYLKVEVTEEYYRGYTRQKNDSNGSKSNRSSIECIKKIDLKDFGTGRQIRFGRNQGKPFMIMAQHQKRMYRDSFASISCLTAVDFEGHIMWQIGKPNNSFDTTLISCDLPFQVYDINHDGIDELIYCRNFEIIIINAVTGELIKKMPTPYVKGDALVKDYPYDRLNVDAIRVADFRKLGYKNDFIIKDRYSNVWAFDYDFNLLFRYNHKNTGHFPLIFDFDHDGIDEMFVGYDLVKNGEILWSLPLESDHTDEIIYEPLEEKGEPKLLLASGNEGFNVCSIDGKIIKSIDVGHAQRVSLAKFDAKRDGYQICVTSFWGANNIIYTFDKDLHLISEKELVGNGNIITPVNYDNQEDALILLNTSPKYGGLVNVNLEVVVEFPDDGHPTLSSEAFDIDGDGVDEILTWDANSLWIYKCSKKVNAKKKFKRYDEFACSNYRGEFLIEIK